MSKRMSDFLKPEILAAEDYGTSSSIEGVPIFIGDAANYMVLANVGTYTTVAAAGPMKMYIQAATASTGTYSTIASGITVQASGATQTGMSEVRIKMAGAQASGAAQTLICDGVTITKSSGANNTAATAAAFKSSGATVCVLNLETVIPAVCTNLECTRVSTAATACEVKVYPKKAGYTFDFQSTVFVQATSAKLGFYGGKKIFSYDFTAADVVGKNSSYSHVKVGITNTAGSAIPVNLLVLKGTNRFDPMVPRYPNRSKFSTVSSAHST